MTCSTIEGCCVGGDSLFTLMHGFLEVRSSGRVIGRQCVHVRYAWFRIRIRHWRRWGMWLHEPCLMKQRQCGKALHTCQVSHGLYPPAHLILQTYSKRSCTSLVKVLFVQVLWYFLIPCLLAHQILQLWKTPDAHFWSSSIPHGNL
jgi:hypothetical protein